MKTIVLFFLIILSAVINLKAENEGMISYFPVVTGKDITQASSDLLKSKMEQIMTINGFGSMDHAGRFIMLAKCNIIEKDIAPTTPPRISQKAEITFIIGDAVENKTYASTSLELSGIGTNETKAWQATLARIKPNNPLFKQMFEEATEKIVTYYTTQCKNIIAKARTLASTGENDEAIAILMNVPDICEDCYKDAMAAVSEIYQDKIDREGGVLLAKAKNAWAASQNENGAIQAMLFINEIDLNSSSFPDAENLVTSISKKISIDKERQWQFKVQKYKDEKEFRDRKYADEIQYKNQQQANYHARFMATLDAARSVAESWFKSKSEIKNYLNW